MVYELTQSTRECVKTLLDVGTSVKMVAKQAHVPSRSVYRIRKNLREHGTTKAPKKEQQGRPPAINPKMQEVCSILGRGNLTSGGTFRSIGREAYNVPGRDVSLPLG